MFDLFRTRDKAVRIVLGGLLGLVALSMLIYLIPGAGGLPSTGNGSEVVAEVAGDTVTTKDIQELIQERLQSRQVPPEMMQYLLPQLIDQRISDIAVAYQAKRMGFSVTDADLATAIRGLPNLGSLPPDQYRQYIEQMGMSVPEFENNMRKRLYVLQLQNVALEGVVVTPKEVQDEFSRRNEKAKIEYIAFDPSKIKADVKPTPEQLQSYFATVHGQFSVPETRSLRLVIADPQMIGATLQISDNDTQQYYSSHKDQFRTPERVHVRHILLMTTNKSKEEVAKIRTKADELLKQVKGGGDFAALATQNSEDPGSKTKGGDLGWVVRGQTVKNFETSAFSLKPNQISDIVTTEYGFHILQVLEKQDAHLQSLDETKGQIAEGLKKNMLNDRVQSLADQARAEIAKAPQNAEQIAQKLGLNFQKADKFKSGDPLPLIGVDKQTSETIASLKQGEVSPVLQAGNRLAIAVVDSVTPSHGASFADVEPQVRDRYQTEQAGKLVTERSKKAADMLNSNGGDLAAVAKSMGLEVKKTDWFSRQGAVEGVGSASYFGDAFTKPAGTSLGAVNVGNQTVVAKVLDKQNADLSRLTAERDGILQQLKGKKAEERNILFEDSIMNKLIEEKKVKKHRDVINRILARYRA